MENKGNVWKIIPNTSIIFLILPVRKIRSIRKATEVNTIQIYGVVVSGIPIIILVKSSKN